MKYRPDIDGLRAVAVLSVLLYHTDESLLTGGFIGVDIFFVISGYLITKLIVTELATSSDFSFKTFYLRRARRLLPALFFTFAFSLVCAYALFSPQHLASFGESVVYAVLSISNILFWFQNNYFDQSNLFKPLLHTWSLGIEEQFYFIWPALLWALYKYAKPRLILGAVIFLGLMSLALNHLFLINEQALIDQFPDLDVRSTLFYLLPFRVFEFAIGAILVWLVLPANRLFRNELLFTIGLALIAYSLFEFDSRTTFPSFNALIPCVGAALLIASGPQNRFNTLLSNRLMVGVGLISYSLYLIHWPIIVFYNYWKYESLGGTDYAIIISASLLAGLLMYHYVEQPFRRPKPASNKRFVVLCIAIAVGISTVAWNAFTSSGWLWRYPAEVVKQLSFKQGDYSEFFWNHMSVYDRPFISNGRAKVLLIGDSMGADLLNAIVEGGHAEQLDLSSIKVKHNCRGLMPLPAANYQYLYGGQKDICLREHQRLKSDPRIQQADAIILASYWWENKYIEPIRESIIELNRETSARVFVAGIKTQRSNGIYFLTKNLMAPNMHQIRQAPHPQTLSRNHEIQKIEQDFTYLNLMDQFCNKEGCQRVMESGHVIIFDESHLSPKGAEFVGAELDKSDWFQKLVNANQQPNTATLDVR